MTWLHALALFAAILRRFGRPADLVAHRLHRRAAVELRAGLRRLEALIRVLLDAAAARLPEWKSRALMPADVFGRAQWGRGGFASADSADWGVSYAGLRARPSRRAPKPARRRTRPQSARADVSPWPLAERLEAIHRVLRDPARFIRRRARAIRRALARPIKRTFPGRGAAEPRGPGIVARGVGPGPRIAPIGASGARDLPIPPAPD